MILVAGRVCQDDNCYDFTSIRDTWENVRRLCEADRGDLAIPKDIQSQAFIDNIGPEFPTVFRPGLMIPLGCGWMVCGYNFIDYVQLQ